jgi:proteasome assembly chaperone (PAC2) family protein
MAVKLYKEPELKRPIMLCAWSGIANVGLVAINTIRRFMRAEEFGQIEPLGYFDPTHVVIANGLIEEMRFPATRFFSHHRPERDVIFVVGERQPEDTDKAYEMAAEVLDVAERLGCRRVYTSGASVTAIHHTAKPRVWAVPNSRRLVSEIRRYGNTILMSGVDGTDGQGSITGLNGLLLGVAKSRDIEAVCLLGEVPYYLQGAPWPYPKASIAVLEVLGGLLNIPFDLSELHQSAAKVEASIDQILATLADAEELPEQVREEMDGLRHPRHSDLGPITEQEKQEILDHLDDLFRGEVGNES